MLDAKQLRALSSGLIAEPDDYMHSFRRNISMYIDHKEITLQEVAELAELSVSTLKTFLYGNCKDCTLSTAIKLARVFNVSVDELVGAGTISPQTCKSLQTMRQLPESFTHFVRWGINFHYNNLKSHNVSKRAIEVMYPETGAEGNLKMSNKMEILDISDLNDDIRPKIFMGIRIPNGLYEPHFFQGEIALLANDRNPRDKDRVVFSTADNLWILERNEEDGKVIYRSIRTGRAIAEGNDIEYILGYVAKVYRNDI